MSFSFHNTKMSTFSNASNDFQIITIGDDGPPSNTVSSHTRGLSRPPIGDMLPMPATSAASQYISPTHSSPYTPNQPSAPPPLYSPGSMPGSTSGSFNSNISMGSMVPPPPPVTSGMQVDPNSVPSASATSATKTRLSLGRTGSISQRMPAAGLTSPHIMVPASPHASPQVCIYADCAA